MALPDYGSRGRVIRLFSWNRRLSLARSGSFDTFITVAERVVDRHGIISAQPRTTLAALEARGNTSRAMNSANKTRLVRKGEGQLLSITMRMQPVPTL